MNTSPVSLGGVGAHSPAHTAGQEASFGLQKAKEVQALWPPAVAAASSASPSPFACRLGEAATEWHSGEGALRFHWASISTGEPGRRAGGPRQGCVLRRKEGEGPRRSGVGAAVLAVGEGCLKGRWAGRTPAHLCSLGSREGLVGGHDSLCWGGEGEGVEVAGESCCRQVPRPAWDPEAGACCSRSMAADDAAAAEGEGNRVGRKVRHTPGRGEGGPPGGSCCVGSWMGCVGGGSWNGPQRYWGVELLRRHSRRL